MIRPARHFRFAGIALMAIVGMAWTGATASACSMDSGSGCCCAAAPAEKPGCCSSSDEGPVAAPLPSGQVSRRDVATVESRPCNAFFCGRPAAPVGDRPRQESRSIEETPAGVCVRAVVLDEPSPPRPATSSGDRIGVHVPEIPLYLRTLHLIF